MRRLGLLVLLLLLTAIRPGLAAGERPGPEQFRRSAPLVAPAAGFANGSLYRVALTAEILAAVEPDFADLRLFDAAGRETPFVVLENRIPGQPEAWLTAELTEYAPDAGNGEEVLTFRLPESGRAVTGLDLRTAGRDFHKAVALESSPDGTVWTPAAAGEVYDFSSRVPLRRTTLDLPALAGPLFRLHLRNASPRQEIFSAWRMTHGDLDIKSLVLRPEHLRIQSVALRLAGIPEQVVWDETEHQVLTVGTDHGDTVVDLPARLPAGRITLRISTAMFNRTVEVSGSLGPDAKRFTRLGQGSITRLPTPGGVQGNATILVGQTWQRDYRLRIRDQGAPPLEIDGVGLAWPQRLLFFMPQTDSPAMSLFFVARQAHQTPRPIYDLSRVVTQANWFQMSAVQVTAGPAMGSQDGGGGWTLPSGNWALSALVLVLCGVLTAWLAALLRRR